MADKKWVIITPQQIEAAAISPTHSVLLKLDVSAADTGLAPGLVLALEFSPSQAREFGRMLLRKADEAEAGLPRA